MTKPLYIYSAFMLYIASCIFFIYQNLNPELGGPISFIKAGWLGIAIFYWLVLPLIISIDSKTSKIYRIVYIIFFANILIRGFIELYLMYSLDAWKYEYGIVHNIFSICLLVALVFFVNEDKSNKLFKWTLIIFIGMFMAELYFSLYMHFNMNVGTDNTIWFIPWESKHLVNNLITCIVVLFLVVWQFHFYWTWNKS